jgi:hypothetical protein
VVCGSGSELQLCQQGPLTIAVTLTMKSFDNELCLRFLYLNFFPLAPNQMVLISRLWEGEDVFLMF